MLFKQFCLLSLIGGSLGVLALCCTSVSAQAPAKVWSIDLGADADFYKRLSVHEVLLIPPSVNFLNDSQIICGFYDRKEIGFDPSLTEHAFHVLEIDAHTGAFGRKLDFAAINDRSQALPVGDGGFLVLAAQELRKFSSSFLPGPSYPTPIGGTNQRRDIAFMDVTPNGREVVLYTSHGQNRELKWLRSDDLSIVKTLPTGGHLLLRASSADVITESTPCPGCVQYFLTDDLLFVTTGHKYSIETMTGEKRASGKLDGGMGDFTRAAKASRFAYLSGRYTGGSGFLIQTNFKSLTAKIKVMDWTTNKQVGELEVNEPAGNPSAGMTQSALALSPDGKYLLVLLHHTLTCYRLSR